MRPARLSTRQAPSVSGTLSRFNAHSGRIEVMSEQSPQRESQNSDAILVNGEPHRLPLDATVAGLLTALAIAGRRIAVAVNREVVPRSAYAGHPLSPGDRVEILEAVGGG